MSRPLQFQDSPDDIQAIKFVAKDISSSPEYYCIAKFKQSFSKGPAYKIFFKEKLQFDQKDISYAINLGKDFDPLSKMAGELAGISGYLFDPLIFITITIIIVSFASIKKSKRTSNA